jgi:hypothetical protein
MGIYLYCITQGDKERAFENAAAVGSSASPVRTIVEQGLAAVVSDCEQTRFDTSRVNLMAHERVVEQVMREASCLLPVRFGTVASPPEPEQDIRRLLRVRRVEFDRLLHEMQGKVEVGVKALWQDTNAVFQEIASEWHEVRRLRDRIEGQPERTPQIERVRLGEMVKEALDRKRERQAVRILEPLRPLAAEVVENPVVLDRMILNAAFLVSAEQDSDFDRAVRELDAQLAPRVVLRHVGPVPPYNFVNITVSWDEVRRS